MPQVKPALGLAPAWPRLEKHDSARKANSWHPIHFVDEPYAGPSALNMAVQNGRVPLRFALGPWAEQGQHSLMTTSSVCPLGYFPRAAAETCAPSRIRTMSHEQAQRILICQEGS